MLVVAPASTAPTCRGKYTNAQFSSCPEPCCGFSMAAPENASGAAVPTYALLAHTGTRFLPAECQAWSHLCISLNCPARRRSSSDSTESAGLWPLRMPLAAGWLAESPLCAPSESPLPPLTAQVLLMPLVPLRAGSNP